MTKTDEKMKKIKLYQEEIKLFLMGLGAVSATVAFIARWIFGGFHPGDLSVENVPGKMWVPVISTQPHTKMWVRVDWLLVLFFVLVVVFIGWGIMYWLGMKRRGASEKN